MIVYADQADAYVCVILRHTGVIWLYDTLICLAAQSQRREFDNLQIMTGKDAQNGRPSLEQQPQTRNKYLGSPDQLCTRSGGMSATPLTKVSQFNEKYLLWYMTSPRF